MTFNLRIVVCNILKLKKLPQKQKTDQKNAYNSTL